jgi:hypothetical protein
VCRSDLFPPTSSALDVVLEDHASAILSQAPMTLGELSLTSWAGSVRGEDVLAVPLLVLHAVDCHPGAPGEHGDG